MCPNVILYLRSQIDVGLITHHWWKNLLHCIFGCSSLENHQARKQGGMKHCCICWRLLGGRRVDISASVYYGSHVVTLTFLCHACVGDRDLCHPFSVRRQIKVDRATATCSTPVSREYNSVDGGHMPRIQGSDTSHRSPSAFLQNNLTPRAGQWDNDHCWGWRNELHIREDLTLIGEVSVMFFFMPSLIHIQIFIFYDFVQRQWKSGGFLTGFVTNSAKWYKIKITFDDFQLQYIKYDGLDCYSQGFKISKWTSHIIWHLCSLFVLV